MISKRSDFLNRVIACRLPAASFPIALLGICIASYGLLINKQGLYWDDWTFAWIWEKLGSRGLTTYFSTNRPYWGLIYQLTFPVLGVTPWHWLVFVVFWRWVNGVSLWWLVRQVWPRHLEAAAWIALFFVVYPGFQQEPIAIMYSHFMIVLTAFFLSIVLNIKAIRQPSRAKLYTAASLVLGLVNLMAMEYFILLEALRPVFLFFVTSEFVEGFWRRVKRTFLSWLPYLGLLILVAAWRLFFFRYQTQNYQPVVLQSLKENLLQTLIELAKTVLTDVFNTSIGAWSRVFHGPNSSDVYQVVLWQWLVVVIFTALLIGSVLFWQRRKDEIKESRTRVAFQLIAAGIIGLLVAGWPFWVTGLGITFNFPNSRFTLPFMLGASLIMAGFILFVLRWRWIQILAVAVLIGLAAGQQYQAAVGFSADWTYQKNYFWQLKWRVPALAVGTTVVQNESVLHYVTDNSLTAPLNWIYAPGPQRDQLAYLLYYPTIRLPKEAPYLKPGQPITKDFLVATFNGNANQVIVVSYSPNKCLRVLDPELDGINPGLPKELRRAAPLSNWNLIYPVSADHLAIDPPTDIFGAEQAHDWCYYFEKADLARQQGDWTQAAVLGDEGLRRSDSLRAPDESFPFIEAYAHIGRWQDSIDLTAKLFNSDSALAPLVCQLWQRIERTTTPDAGQIAAFQAVQNRLKCQK